MIVPATPLAFFGAVVYLLTGTAFEKISTLNLVRLSAVHTEVLYLLLGGNVKKSNQGFFRNRIKELTLFQLCCCEHKHLVHFSLNICI